MICAIVLAAGMSRRMGVQKLLLPFEGKTVIEHIVAELLCSTVDHVLVVVGYQNKYVAEKLPRQSITIVTNPNYRNGMLSSVRCGIQALPQECSAVMLALGDQPAISTELVDEMVQSFVKTDRGIVVPYCQQRRGHPLMFSMKYQNEIMTNFDKVGLRGLLHTHPEDVFELDISNSSVLSDMDFPEDYRREVGQLDEEP
jgi:molybdenum cofactor cytidylyltransferase